MPRGTTLIELLLALLIAAIVTALALPAIGTLRNSMAVAEAASAVAGAHARARLLALVERRVMILTLTPDTLVLRAVEGSDTIERWRGAGPARAGVAVSGFSRQIAFAPGGVAFGFANGTYRFTRGSASRQVIVSRYGRVRQE